MSSAEDKNIQRLFQKAGLNIQPDGDEQVFQDVLAARRKAQQNSPLPWSRWRTTMKSPITKLAVAAVITIAAITGVSMWRHTGSGIALADVLAQVQQITAYMYQMTMTVGGKSPVGQPMNQNIEATVLSSQSGDSKMTMAMLDPNGRRIGSTETYMVPQEKAIYSIMPEQKMYLRMDLDDTLIERSREQNNDPTAMLQQILKCKYESLGRSRLNGVEVEGFRTTDPNYLGGVMGAVDLKMWVDVKTQLPVQSEMDMQVGELQVHGLVHDFQWNYPVNADTFKPVIPADYTPMPGGPIKAPAISEEGAVEGLKILADRTGRYPEKLDLATLMGQLTKIPDANSASRSEDEAAAKKMFESGVSKEEAIKEITKNAAKKTLDIMLPVESTALFYMTLVKDQKDPAYHGDVVTPQDATQVLMRWKVSDNRYRVIFGNLHAETVDAATLAELEKTLPK
jgi:outer membrane lipoprotein-sorting protein